MLVIGWAQEDFWAFCDDVCAALVRGKSGAQVYYAGFDYPAAPDFTQPVNLRSIAQGRIHDNPNSDYRDTFEPFHAGQAAPTFEHVIVDMRQVMTPVLAPAVTDYGFRKNLAEAWTIFAPVPDDQAYEMTYDGTHYIDYSRVKAFGTKTKGGYYFPVFGPDYDKEAMILQNAYCGPFATNRENCAR